MKSTFYLKFLLIVIASCLLACQEIKARDEANEGKDALLNCDFESAFIHFENAHDIIQDNDDINIGLATSELLLTLNAKEFTDIFYQLGFTQSVQDFCIQNINRKKETQEQTTSDGCHSSLNIQMMTFSHPCANSEQCQYKEYIQPELTWHDILNVFELYRTNFEHISTLFAQTASHLTSNYTIHDIFGTDAIHIHRADLYFFAALIELSLFVTSTANHYQTTFSVYQTLITDECIACSDFLNQNIGIADSTVDASEYEPQLLSAFSYIHQAFQYAKAIRTDYDNSSDSCPPKVSLLNWSDVPYGVTDNILSLTSAFQTKPYIIQDIISPEITLDLHALLTSMPSRQSTQTLASCNNLQLEIHYSNYINAINTNTSPALLNADTDQFELAPGLSYRLSSGWRHWTPMMLF